ncbi:MAG: hypothetical protein KF795_34020 [Labilithrix sp.]|nr:hypothetical protein [Labilithrix sp.]
MQLATSSARQRPPVEHASEKRSLASILRDHGPLPVTDAVDIALDVCDELANAHANGVVHGDLGLHRVRTHWPLLPKQRADIFALGEDDSAAFAFRASAVAILMAPEQRQGAVVDTRADVWAVGAILHWMIAGVPPSTDPVAQTLARAPRSLVVTVEACLADDPTRRPQSVDEVAEVIGSLASSPPERFEQLARRRAALVNAKRVRTDLGDVDGVLGRLDDAALARELVAAAAPAPPPSPVEPAIDRLVHAVHQSTGSLIFDDSGSVTDLGDDEPDAETVLAQPSLAELHASERGVLVASPLSISPVVLSSELLAPPKPPVAEASPPAAVAPPDKMKRSTMALAIVGGLLAVSLGVGIGMHLVERAVARHDTAAGDIASGVATPLPPSPVAASPAVGTASPVTASPAVGTASPVTASPAVGTPSPSPPADAPAVMSVASLPDARPLSPASLPDARPLSPASLPDARPLSPAPRLDAKAGTGARPSPPRASASATDDERVPAGFKTFDGTSDP